MDELICNYKKCRKVLKTVAWVTSCSHVFCDEDGTREFSKAFVCPACQTTLMGKYDIVRTDLAPTEHYKSMVLAGHRPDTIMEMASRGLAFWTYQAQQEKAFHVHIAQKARDSCSKLENYYSSVSNKMENEISSLRSELTSRSKEVEETKQKLAETNEKLQERIRQQQKLQNMYDSLKRKSISHMISEEEKIVAKPSPQLQMGTSHVSLRTADGNYVNNCEHFNRPVKYMPRPRFKQNLNASVGDDRGSGFMTPLIFKGGSSKSSSDIGSYNPEQSIPYPAPTHIDLDGKFSKE